MDATSVEESTSIDSTSVITPPSASEISIEAESKKLPSSRFKGVVPQPNGRWGAQIYEKHQRVWLGTFNEESEAAGAYDTAAIRFRGRDAIINLKRNEQEDVFEIAFLNSHSKSEIVDMLRKHTFMDELEQCRRKRGPCDGDFMPGRGTGFPHGPARAHEQLFEKVVTPSDVGKLNRLVIPKQYAEKHFPFHSGTASSSKGILLNFEDIGGKVWRFRYSYWNSSQSYVLTKGWSRFVKEKGLRAGDTVSFGRANGPDKQLYIDWKQRGNAPDVVAGRVGMVRLFGVNIFEVPDSGVATIDGGGCGGEKRMRGMEILGLECNKKQRVVDAL